MTAYLVETFAVLVLIGLVGIVVVVGGRRLGIGRTRGPIELAGYLALDARRAIYLVRVGAQVLVVGTSEAGLTKIGETQMSALPKTATPRPMSFASLLTGRRPPEPTEDE